MDFGILGSHMYNFILSVSRDSLIFFSYLIPPFFFASASAVTTVLKRVRIKDRPMQGREEREAGNRGGGNRRGGSRSREQGPDGTGFHGGSPAGDDFDDSAQLYSRI